MITLLQMEMDEKVHEENEKNVGAEFLLKLLMLMDVDGRDRSEDTAFLPR